MYILNTKLTRIGFEKLNIISQDEISINVFLTLLRDSMWHLLYFLSLFLYAAYYKIYDIKIER